jgi:hypothetical protein
MRNWLFVAAGQRSEITEVYDPFDDGRLQRAASPGRPQAMAEGLARLSAVVGDDVAKLRAEHLLVCVARDGMVENMGAKG